MKVAIAYYRVSTDRQGISGLGLEAQKQAVQQFTGLNGFALTDELVEVETGKKHRRPILQLALEACKKQQATLLIAKLDRLARNVAFVSALIESGVDFKAVDMPDANKLMVHVIAAFAEYERDMISARTTEALRAARQRGVELGKYGRDVLSKQNKGLADRFALSLLPLVDELRRKGIKTVREITDEFNRRKIPTYRNSGRWHESTVHNIIQRQKRVWK